MCAGASSRRPDWDSGNGRAVQIVTGPGRLPRWSAASEHVRDGHLLVLDALTDEQVAQLGEIYERHRK